MYYKHKKTKSYLKNVFVTQFSWQKKAFLAKFSSKISAKSKKIFLLKNDYWNWKNQGKEISPESNFAICEIMKYKFRHILTEKSQTFSFPHFPHFQIFGPLWRKENYAYIIAQITITIIVHLYLSQLEKPHLKSRQDFKTEKNTNKLFAIY